MGFPEHMATCHVSEQSGQVQTNGASDLHFINVPVWPGEISLSQFLHLSKGDNLKTKLTQGHTDSISSWLLKLLISSTTAEGNNMIFILSDV